MAVAVVVALVMSSHFVQSLVDLLDLPFLTSLSLLDVPITGSSFSILMIQFSKFKNLYSSSSKKTRSFVIFRDFSANWVMMQEAESWIWFMIRLGFNPNSKLYLHIYLCNFDNCNCMCVVKNVVERRECVCSGSPPPACYSGSLPGRTDSPLVHDVQFAQYQVELVSPLTTPTKVSEQFGFYSASNPLRKTTSKTVSYWVSKFY